MAARVCHSRARRPLPKGAVIASAATVAGMAAPGGMFPTSVIIGDSFAQDGPRFLDAGQGLPLRFALCAGCVAIAASGQAASVSWFPHDTPDSNAPRRCKPPAASSGAFRVVFLIAGLLILSAGLTLRTVVHPGTLSLDSGNPTPYGYTWSLSLFIIPLAVLSGWFARRPDLELARQGFWRTIAVLAPRLPAGPALRQRVLHVSQSLRDAGRECSCRGRANPHRGVCLLRDRVHAGADELLVGG